MELTEQDKKAAEELLREFPGIRFCFTHYNEEYEAEHILVHREQIQPLLTKAILLGIEHERKRHQRTKKEENK